MGPSQPTKDFEAAVHGALQLWHKDPGLAGPLARLVLVQQEQAATGKDLRQAANQVLLDALDALAADHEPDAALLRARFLDGKPAFVVAIERHVADVTLFRIQRPSLSENSKLSTAFR